MVVLLFRGFLFGKYPVFYACRVTGIFMISLWRRMVLRTIVYGVNDWN